MTPGIVLVVVWAAGVVAAWRPRAGALLRLHLVLAASVGAAALAFSRIYGLPFAYLSLWSLGLAGLVLLAIGWSIGLVGSRVAPATVAERVRPVVTAVLIVALMALGATTTAKASSAEPTEPAASRVLDSLAGATIDALQSGDLPGTGEDGTYFVTSRDPVYVGAISQGLVNELERDGLRAGSSEGLRVALGAHRVLDPGEATAEVHVAVGAAAAEERPGSVVVARFDPAETPLGDRYDEVRAQAVERLQDAAPDLVDRVAEGSIVNSDPRVDTRTRSLLDELREIGVPAATFVGPPSG
jgi:hypothetical protein